MHNDSINTAKKHLVILYQLPESWANVRSVWQAARADDAVDVSVILLPFIHRDYQWQRDQAEAHLRALGVPFVPWDTHVLDGERIDAVLFGSSSART